jgi:osmoprotectant transport system substrate-binding protein
MLKRWMPRIALALGVALWAGACRPNARQRIPITVASARTPEQMVLGKMTVLALKAEGYRVSDKTGLGIPSEVRMALTGGSIDICWEYTGDAWKLYLGHDVPIKDPHELYEKVQSEDTYKQITWLAMAPAQRTVTMAMREETARKAQIVTLSDLVQYAKQVNPHLTVCTSTELRDRVDGLRGFESYYRLRFAEDSVRVMPAAQGYAALARGECDCALVLSTDGEIAAQGLRLLQDDQQFFQGSNLAPVVRTALLQEYPDVERVLTRLSHLLTQAAMTELNHQVMLDGAQPEKVARRFLTKNRILGPSLGTLIGR